MLLVCSCSDFSAGASDKLADVASGAPCELNDVLDSPPGVAAWDRERGGSEPGRYMRARRLRPNSKISQATNSPDGRISNSLSGGRCAASFSSAANQIST